MAWGDSAVGQRGLPGGSHAVVGGLRTPGQADALQQALEARVVAQWSVAWVQAHHRSVQGTQLHCPLQPVQRL